VAGSCEHGNEPSGTIEGMEFFDQLKESTPWSDLAPSITASIDRSSCK